jgi:hypothetical protein
MSRVTGEYVGTRTPRTRGPVTTTRRVSAITTTAVAVAGRPVLVVSRGHTAVAGRTDVADVAKVADVADVADVAGL